MSRPEATDRSGIDAGPGPAEPDVFAEPWQAEAFALAVALHGRGLFSWQEWAAALAGEVGRPDAAADGGTGVPEITPRDLATKLQRGDEFDLLDVREPHEQDIARIDGARLVPLGDFASALGTLDSARDIVVMCRSGARSAKAEIDHVRGDGHVARTRRRRVAEARALEGEEDG